MPKKENTNHQPSFEEAINRLSDIVRQLEEGSLTLDESLAQYEEGIRHLGQCQKILSQAERKIEVLSGFDADGKPVTQRFDDEELTLHEKADQRSRRRTARSKKQDISRDSGQPAGEDHKRKLGSNQDDVDSGGTLF